MAAKKFIFTLLTLLTFLFTAYVGYYIYLKMPTKQPKNFDECVKSKGSKVLQENPPACVSAKGQKFIQSISLTPPTAQSEQPISYSSIDQLILSDDTTKKFKSVKGQLVLGGEIDRSYCGAGIYIKDSTGELLLRQSSENGSNELFNKKEFLGKNVEIQGIYPDKTNFCKALICDCENYILVQKVSSLEFGL